MKTLCNLLLLTFIFTKVQSQVYVQGGVNLSNISKTASGETEKNNMLTTFNAGILGRFGLSEIIDLESGLVLDGRGSKVENYFTSATDDNYVKSRFNPLYVELPLNVVVRFPMNRSTNLFFHAGPYVAMGVAGKSTSESRFLGVNSTNSADIKFSNDNPFTSAQDDAAYDKLKRFDFGLNIGGGLDLGKVLLRLNYGFGLTKINSTQSDNNANDKNKYRTLSLSLGIPLSRK